MFKSTALAKESLLAANVKNHNYTISITVKTIIDYECQTHLTGMALTQNA